MRNSKEISAELEAKINASASVAGAERAAMASEIEGLTRELQDAQIDEAAKRALANQRTFTEAEKKDVRKFSYSKFLREAMTGNLTGVEAEMDAEGKKEQERALGTVGNGYHLPSALLRTATYNNVGTSGEGLEFAHVTEMSFAEAVHKAMVCNRLGVRFLDGLQGNVGIVKGGAATASWKSEEAAEAAQKIAYSLATLKPKRVAATAGYTYDLLRQSSLPVDQLIQDELVKSVASAIDEAVFAGTSPKGLAGEVADSSSTINKISAAAAAAPTWAEFVNMETMVGEDNCLDGRLAYVINAKTAGYCKTTPKISGYPAYILENGMINGYQAVITNEVPAADAYFGNFEEVLVGSWGGLNIIVDPFSQKTKGVVEVAVNSYNDVLVRRPEAFAAISNLNIA